VGASGPARKEKQIDVADNRFARARGPRRQRRFDKCANVFGDPDPSHFHSRRTRARGNDRSYDGRRQ
jgi:hypothetical protein